MALTVDVALAGCGGIIVMPYYVIFLGTMRILHLLTLHLDSQWQLLAGSIELCARQASIIVETKGHGKW